MYYDSTKYEDVFSHPIVWDGLARRVQGTRNGRGTRLKSPTPLSDSSTYSKKGNQSGFLRLFKAPFNPIITP